MTDTLPRVLDRHATLAQALEAAVLDGSGSLSPETRRDLAHEGAPAAALEYAATLRTEASRASDELVAAVIGAGYTEDQVYEMTVSVALGQGLRRLAAGRRAIEALSWPTGTPDDERTEQRAEPADRDGPWNPVLVVDADAEPLAQRQPEETP